MAGSVAWLNAQLKKRGNDKGKNKKAGDKNLPAKAVSKPFKKPKKIPTLFAWLAAIIVLALLLWLIDVSQIFSEKDVCSGFEGADYKVSCEEAVNKALAVSPGEGKVQNVSTGIVRAQDTSSAEPKRVDKEAWLIDVKLNSATFDNDLNREVSVLRIGLGLNEYLGIYKEALG